MGKSKQYFSCSENTCRWSKRRMFHTIRGYEIYLIDFVLIQGVIPYTGSDNTCPWHKHRIFHTYEVYLMVVCTYALRFSFSPFFSVSVDSTSICFILFFLFECVPFNLGRNSYHMHVRYDEYIYQYTGWSFPPAQWPWLFVVFFMYLLVVDCRVGRRYMPYMHASAWVGIPFLRFSFDAYSVLFYEAPARARMLLLILVGGSAFLGLKTHKVCTCSVRVSHVLCMNGASEGTRACRCYLHPMCFMGWVSFLLSTPAIDRTVFFPRYSST